jgi:hypothetical protein
LKKLAFFLLVCLAIGRAASAAPEGIECEIQFYDKRIYYLDDPASPIQIQVTIINNSPRTFYLKIADSRVFNLDFSVATPSNLRLDHSGKYTTTKNSNQPVFFREIGLQTGEKYGLVVDLGDFIRLDSSGQYLVQALFYPELLTPKEADALRSNKLSLNVRPAVDRPEEKALIEAETGMLIQREARPPDEVVSYTLTARQKNQWEKFFLYIDLESLYRRNPQRGRQYERMPEVERRAALEEFRRKLKSEVMDQDILLIPHQFEILKTSYTPAESTVLVIEKFKYPDYTEVKQFTYHLEKRDRFWIITDYEVLNKGTE